MMLSRSLPASHRRAPFVGFVHLLAFAAAAWMALGPAYASAQTLPLWEVTRDGRLLHLFGTLVMGRPELFPLPKPVRQAFEKAATIAVEIDPSAQSVQDAVVAGGMLPAGTDLVARIGAQEWERLRPVLERFSIDPAIARRMKPWMLVSTLATLAQEEAGFVPELGMDAMLVKFASEREKKVVELDSFAAQLKVLDEVSVAHGAAWLRRTSTQIVTGATAKDAKAMLEAWRAGDLEAVQRIVEQDVLGDSSAREINARIFGAKQQAIVSGIERIIREGRPTAVAVSVAALAGPDGVIARLVKAGFRVRQLTVTTDLGDAPAQKK